MGRVFISYRRADSAGYTGRIYDYLRHYFGENQIFMDVDNIEPGQDFVKVLEDAVSSCDALIAVIGKQWISITDEKGKRRLDSPHDFVRIEIETALRRNILVIPVLVDGSSMPSLDMLPDSLMPLSRRNALEISNSRFDHEAGKLAKTLETEAGLKPQNAHVEDLKTLPQNFDIHTEISNYFQALDNKDVKKAYFLFENIRMSGKAPRTFDIAHEEKVLRELLPSAEVENEYNILRLRASRERPKVILDALYRFWEIYPGYDPDNLGELLRPIPQTSILPMPFEWCEIPQGFVTLEEAREVDLPSSLGGTLEVASFMISKYPITNSQYDIFLEATDGFTNTQWWDYSSDARKWRKENPNPEKVAFLGNDLPRTNISWYDAVAFCQWLSNRTRETITLPNEQQWQRASQGNDNRNYPWGNTFNPDICNFMSEKLMDVDSFLKGSSPFAVMDLSGNAWEWCLNDWRTGRTDLTITKARRSLRGGSCWDGNEDILRSSYRDSEKPDTVDEVVGFRIVKL